MIIILWKAILQSLIMGFAFLVPFAFCRIADISFGAVLASKLDSLTFNYRKLLRGILYMVVTLFGLACLIAGITMIPALLEYYNITAVDVTVLKGVLDIVVIITTIVMSAITYGKDAYDKFKLLLQKGAPPDDSVKATEMTTNT